MPAGFVRRDRLPRLERPDAPFERTADGTHELLGTSPAERTQHLQAFARVLAGEGAFSVRGETFAVAPSFGAPELLRLDRGAVPWFGVRPVGVHVCGYVRTARGLDVWVAVRSRTKSFPGAWDNTVAGGQPVDLSLLENVVKECAEEASIPRDLAVRAVERNTLSYVREDATGLKPDTIFVFDLELPADFEPRPADGEVERFVRLPAIELARIVRDEPRCKPNCSLVWIDFLLRHGLLDAELSLERRQALGKALRAPLP